MNNQKLTKEIFEKIKEKHISPKPKWQFKLKGYFVWTVFAVSIVIGGVAISIIIFTLVNSDWNARTYVSGGLGRHMIVMVPYLWIALLSLFIFTADYNFKHTKKGYRYGLLTVIGISVFASLVLGSSLYAFGIGHRVDNILGQKFNAYQDLGAKRLQMWNHSERGLLAGIIVSVEDDSFVLKDVGGNEWTVLGDKLPQIHKVIFNNIDNVRVIGIKIEEGVFEACAVLPWTVKGESKRVQESAMMRGIKKERFDNVRNKLREQNLDERNIFDLRNSLCERSAFSTSR
jgi:hypothetical protein